MFDRLPRPRFSSPWWLSLILAAGGVATGVAALYGLAQNAVNFRVIANETREERDLRLWKDHPVLGEARRRIAEGESLLFVSGPRAAFRGLVAYALYPRRFELWHVDALPSDEQLERIAHSKGAGWIVVDGMSGFEGHEREDRIWKASESPSQDGCQSR